MEKQKKQKWIFKIVSFLVVLGCAIGITTQYGNIEKAASNRERVNDRILWEAYPTFTNSVLILDAQLHKESSEKQNAYLTERMQVHLLNTEGIDEETQTQLQNRVISETISEMENSYMLSVGDDNAAYWIKDEKSGKVYFSDDDLSSYQTNAELQKKYRFFIQLTYDVNGNLISQTLFDSHTEKDNLKNMEEDSYAGGALSQRSTGETYDEYSGVYVPYEMEYQLPSSMTYVMAVKEDMVHSGHLYHTVYSYDMLSFYIPYALPYVFLVIGIVVLFMLFYPVAVVKQCQPYLLLKKIKLEFILFFGFWGIVLASTGMGLVMAASMNGAIADVLQEIGWGIGISQTITLFNVLLWCIALYLVMYVIFMIKYIFHKGVILYLKEYTVVAWCFMKIKRGCYRLSRFDLESKRNRVLLMVVAANFLVIFLISAMFQYGIFASLLYSVLLFFFLRKELDKVSDDYKKLLGATQKLSDGDFNVDIEEDLGIFNSLRDEFKNIKNGFEKAVKEEVKSQRMKTELISNVSHDLKTPLTSIITYVDLLKGEDVSEEERKQYVDTLDRNALRLKHLIEDLFEVSKVNSGNVSLNIVDVDIVSLIQQAQFECADQIGEADLDVRMQFSHDKMIYQLDSLKTYRIFENLFVNIGKYALPHTRVYIDAVDTGEMVTITFKNISANEITFDAQEITERFVQGDRSRNSGGSGLGLAIAKSFTELQNGSFQIEVDGDLFKAVVILRKKDLS